MRASLRLLQWIICSQHPKILNAHCPMSGVTINSKLLTTPCPINDCFWYRVGSYLAWATYVQDCTFMKYTCSLWKHRPRYNTEEKGKTGILSRPWEEREKAIDNKMNLLTEESQVRKVCKPVCRISPAAIGYSWPRLKSHWDPWRSLQLHFVVLDPPIPLLLLQPCSCCPRPSLLTLCWANSAH